MRNHSSLFFCAILAGLVLTACDKKTEELAYANLTVEQNKEKMQDDGLATITKLEGMSNLSGVFALRDLDNLALNSTLAGDPIEIAISKIIAPLTNMDKNVLGLTNLRSMQADIQNLSDILPQIGGVYTYNRTTEEFIRVANTTKIEFVFPIGSSTTNNGKLLIDNLTISTVSNATTNAEMPKSLDIELSKNSLPMISLEYRAAYNSVNEPTSVSMSISFVEGYDFNETFVHSNTEVSMELKYTFNDENILSSKFSTKGNFSTEALNNESNLEDIEWINQVLDNANAYVQLGNLKVTGVVDINKGIDAYDAAFPNGVTNTAADVDKMCTMLNANATLIVLYAKEGTVIAKSKFYKQEYTSWELNENTWEYKEVTGYEPSLQFIFKDGSAMDQSFFNQGFEDLQTSFEDMLQSFQTNYSE